MGQKPLIESREEYAIEFQALGAMKRHQGDRNRFVVFIRIARERRVIKQFLESLPLQGGLDDRVHEFAQVLGARTMLKVILLLEPIEVARLVGHSLDELRRG